MFVPGAISLQSHVKKAGRVDEIGFVGIRFADGVIVGLHISIGPQLYVPVHVNAANHWLLGS